MVVLKLFHLLIKLQHLCDIVPERRQLTLRRNAKFRLALLYSVQHAALEKIRKISEKIIQLWQGLASNRLVQLLDSTPLGKGNRWSHGVSHCTCFLLDQL